MPYRIIEADTESASAVATIHRFNSYDPEIFPLLKPHHLENGFWWFAYLDGEVVAFAGMVPFLEPIPNIGYLKRAYVLPDHRGHGLQQRFMSLREAKAVDLGWTYIVSECAQGGPSARNFARAGYTVFEPEQRWGAPGSIYWVKSIGRSDIS